MIQQHYSLFINYVFIIIIKVYYMYESFQICLFIIIYE